jgi:hypothetical protein
MSVHTAAKLDAGQGPTLSAAWLARVPGDLSLLERWWHVIETRYSEPQRHYHTMAHIERFAASDCLIILHDLRSMFRMFLEHESRAHNSLVCRKDQSVRFRSMITFDCRPYCWRSCFTI